MSSELAKCPLKVPLLESQDGAQREKGGSTRVLGRGKRDLSLVLHFVSLQPRSEIWSPIAQCHVNWSHSEGHNPQTMEDPGLSLPQPKSWSRARGGDGLVFYQLGEERWDAKWQTSRRALYNCLWSLWDGT